MFSMSHYSHKLVRLLYFGCWRFLLYLSLLGSFVSFTHAPLVFLIKLLPRPLLSNTPYTSCIKRNPNFFTNSLSNCTRHCMLMVVIIHGYFPMIHFLIHATYSCFSVQLSKLRPMCTRHPSHFTHN